MLDFEALLWQCLPGHENRNHRHEKQHLKLPREMEEIIVLTSHKSKFTLS